MVLEIFKEGNQLKMSIFEQKEFTSTIRHYSQCPVSFAQINQLCLEIDAILGRKNNIAKLEHGYFESLRKISQLLWEHLLTRTVKEKLKNTAMSNLLLVLDEELMSIPWELIYDGKDFLSLKFNLGRSVRTKENIVTPQYRSPASKLKMLILANPTGDLKSSYFEGVNIKNQFDKKRNQIRIDFKSTCIDSLYVKKSLRDYDIVHFAGHCEYDADNDGNTGWVLSDARFTTQDILTLGETASLPSLVFSNSCQSAQVGKDSFLQDYQKKTYSLASSFLFSGVRHYIGSIRKIEDPQSLVFSKEFYAQLLSGKSVGESLKLSRWKLVREYGLGCMFWMSYLLYGDPNFVMFQAKEKLKVCPAKNKYIFLRPNKNFIITLILSLFLMTTLYKFYAWLPTVNASAYLLFLKSKQSFNSGKNQETVNILSGVIKKDLRFLSAYSLLADAHYRLGEKDDALKYYFDYAFYSQKRNDKKHLSSAYIMIGWFYHQEGDYVKAADYYDQALVLSRKINDKLNQAVALRKLAVLSMDQDDNNKALELLTKSSEINRERQGSAQHRYNLACDYFDLGLLFTNKEDLAMAKEFYNKSLKIFKNLNLKNEFSDYYFNMGEIYLFDKEYQKALDCYFAGLRLDEIQGNKPSIASDYNMIAELYKEMGNLKESEKFFLKALAISQEIKSYNEIALASQSLGVLYKEQGQKNKAREHLRQAQEIYRGRNILEYQKVKNELLTL